MKNKPTLCYLPRRVDELIDQLDSMDFSHNDVSKSTQSTLDVILESFVASVKKRFGGVFTGDSIALACARMCPGESLLEFKHFDVSVEEKDVLFNNMVDDAMLLVDEGADISDGNVEEACRFMLSHAIKKLGSNGTARDPLLWWQSQVFFSFLYPFVKMLFAIPATSCEAERSFSCAGFLTNHRNNLGENLLPKEFRIRQYLLSGSSVTETIESLLSGWS